MITGKRVKCYDLNDVERRVMPEEYKKLKADGIVKDKPSKKEEQAPKTKENKQAKKTK